MKLLEQRILSEGRVLPGGILKVDGFLNHQMDPMLLQEMARELRRLFDGTGVTRVMTVEASGIALAILTGLEFQCPVVFAKKFRTSNMAGDAYTAVVPSFTHGNVNTIVVARDYVKPGDRVLLVDDFLATGAALVGMKSIVEQAGATVVGAGVAIEKVFQGGGNALRAQGLRVEALASIVSMDDQSLSFS